jgi:hypothetical protein
VAAYQQKEVVEVAEDAARQTEALLQAHSVKIATVESTAGPFLGPYRAAADLVALMSQRTSWETPRGRCDEHNNKFSPSYETKV